MFIVSLSIPYLLCSAILMIFHNYTCTCIMHSTCICIIDSLYILCSLQEVHRSDLDRLSSARRESTQVSGGRHRPGTLSSVRVCILQISAV